MPKLVTELAKRFASSIGAQVKEVDVGSYRRFMRRDYWMQVPNPLRLIRMLDIQGACHEAETDTPASIYSMLEMLDEAGVADGDEFEVLITKTGHRPHGDRRFIMDRWGTFRPETDQECLTRIENLDETRQGENE